VAGGERDGDVDGLLDLGELAGLELGVGLRGLGGWCRVLGLGRVRVRLVVPEIDVLDELLVLLRTGDADHLQAPGVEDHLRVLAEGTVEAKLGGAAAGVGGGERLLAKEDAGDEGVELLGAPERGLELADLPGVREPIVGADGGGGGGAADEEAAAGVAGHAAA
jgi:hypothetical protein